MANKPGLRAVGSDEPAPQKPSKSVVQAAKSGTPRELLVAMRDRIAETVTANCAARDLAALTKRLQDISHDIDAIDARDDADLAGRVRELESALRALAPDHPLLVGSEPDDEKFDASEI
ncbi:Uncharacterised protein [Mycobacteroides abscessus]|uniref:hypothetical protein n=1 Tax=Mycobacteroides abscessus TaxID=36809 RepID=UPI0005E1A131|nr:hypothetical protein [Mycobacteroides abscessus]CPX29537.1 Uncharacterised protein [Mycobacteroides abscessus]